MLTYVSSLSLGGIERITSTPSVVFKTGRPCISFVPLVVSRTINTTRLTKRESTFPLIRGIES
jgi:hypothetical protein